MIKTKWDPGAITTSSKMFRESKAIPTKQLAIGRRKLHQYLGHWLIPNVCNTKSPLAK